MDLKKIDSFLAIGAHCDDIDIRCGGTFSRLTREGKRGCYVVAVENAYTASHYHVANSEEALRIRRTESTKASAFLGAKRLEWLGLKSCHFSKRESNVLMCPSFNSLESLQEELKDVILAGLPPVANADFFPRSRDRLNRLLKNFSPQAVFTHSPDDRHPDHYSLSRFVEIVVRELKQTGKDIDIYFWEPGGTGPITGFLPNFFVQLSEDDICMKQKAIDCYASQFPEGFLSNFASNRARSYGELVNLKYAEAFRKGSCDPADAWEDQPGFFDFLKRDSGLRNIYRL